MTETLTAYVAAATADGYPEEWDLDTLFTALRALFPVSFTPEELLAEVGGAAGLDQDFLTHKILEDAQAAYAKREESLGVEVTRELERKILLSVLDRKWREHLYEMDYLQEGIGLRAMAQRDPLVEYQREGFDLFAAMMDSIKEEIVGYLFNVEVQVTSDTHEVEAKGLVADQPAPQQLRYSASDIDGAVRNAGEVSRNAPCPCGSGKKYKRCHGVTEAPRHMV